MEKILFQPDDYLYIKPHFPLLIHELIAIIGEDATFILLNEKAGQVIPINKSYNKINNKKFNYVAGLIGVDATKKLFAAYSQSGQREIYIPTGKNLRRIIRNRRIIQRYDELIKDTNQNPQHLNQIASNIIAKEFDLSFRQVQNILKNG